MRQLFAFLAVAVTAQAAIQSVSVQGVTATQALLKYVAPDSGACNVEVSESSTFAPLVHDVDPALFSGASSDSRTGSTQNGTERLFVIGKRAAEVGLDGVRYSRALQTATTHYFRITCPATGDTATGSFDTNSIPFGDTYAEAEAIDTQHPGSYAYPTLDPRDRTQQVIDPQTGVLIKRLTMPNDMAAYMNGVPFSVIRSNSWTGLSKLGATDGQAATIAGNNTGKLFLGIDAGKPFSNFANSAVSYGGSPAKGLGYYQPHLIAAVNPGGTRPANPEDAKIVACLTVDGANCYPGGAQYEAVLTTNFQDTPFGGTSTIDLWQSGPGATMPNYTQQGQRGGSVMCDGSNTVQLASGDLFGTWWGPGSTINIAGTDYTVNSVANNHTLTIRGSCPSTIAGTGAFDPGTRGFRTSANAFTQANYTQVIFVYNGNGPGNNFSSVIDQVVNAQFVVTHDFPGQQGVTQNYGFPVGYSAVNFGVLFRKKTPSPDTIAIDYASVNYETNWYFNWTLGGGYELCSLSTVAGPNGHQGYNCAMPDGGLLYWVDAETGESHLFGSTNTAPNVGCGSLSEFFDAKDADTFFCAGTGALYATKYYGNHSEPVKLNPNGNMIIFQNLNNCNTGGSNAPPYTNQQPCLVTSPLTPGTDILTLAQAFTANPAYAPAFDKNLFHNIQFKGVDAGGNLLMQVWRGGGNSIGWDVIYNPYATSNIEGGSSNGAAGNHGCVGGGVSGCVVAAMPGWARPGCRWCATKAGESAYPGWFNNDTYGWTNSGVGTGPYYVPVVDGTANGTINYVDGNSSLVNCPANNFGATGKNCTIVTVGSEPLSPNHGGGETGLPGEAGPAMLGDRFQFEVQLAINNTEQVMLIKKDPGAAPGTWIYTLWRDVNHIANWPDHGYYTTGPNPNLYTVCNANQVLTNYFSGYTWVWNFIDDPHGMNTDGKTIPADPSSIGDHFFWANGFWGGGTAPLGDNRCDQAIFNCYSMRVPNGRDFYHIYTDRPIAGIATKSPSFGHGNADGSNLQSHPTSGGSLVAADRGNYMFDGRPYRGGYASGSVNGSGTTPGTLVAGQLYKFTTAQMTNIDLPFRKVYPTKAFSGNAPLVDISSPATGNVIGTTASDSYKYCVASVANECRSGSAPGDVYVNAPFVQFPYCYAAAQNANLPDDYDICIAGSQSEQDAIMQIAMDKVDNEARYQRVLTKFVAARRLSPFWTPYVTPNGKWMMFESAFPGDGSVNKPFLMAKVPPPAPYDDVNRSDFIPLAISLPAYSGATNAFVRFGYAENGDPHSFFCTSRQESCVVGATAVDPANPFYFEQVESASWHGVPCTSGCTVTIPGIPQRILYYQYIYRSDSGVVYTSPMSVVTTP